MGNTPPTQSYKSVLQDQTLGITKDSSTEIEPAVNPEIDVQIRKYSIIFADFFKFNVPFIPVIQQNPKDSTFKLFAQFKSDDYVFTLSSNCYATSQEHMKCLSDVVEVAIHKRFDNVNNVANNTNAKVQEDKLVNHAQFNFSTILRNDLFYYSIPVCKVYVCDLVDSTHVLIGSSSVAQPKLAVSPESKNKLAHVYSKKYIDSERLVVDIEKFIEKYI
jgi:hypothetical protein